MRPARYPGHTFKEVPTVRIVQGRVSASLNFAPWLPGLHPTTLHPDSYNHKSLSLKNLGFDFAVCVYA